MENASNGRTELLYSLYPPDPASQKEKGSQNKLKSPTAWSEKEQALQFNGCEKAYSYR